MDNLHQQAVQKLDAIASCILLPENTLYDIGIKYGRGGTALFFFLYYRFTGHQKYYDQGEAILEEIFGSVNEGFARGLIADQYAELGKLIELLNATGMYPCDTNELLEGIDVLQQQHFETSRLTGDYDITTGALAAGHYFLVRYRSSPGFKEQLAAMVHWLGEIAIRRNDMAFWRSRLFEDERIYPGHIHGVGSVVVFLVKVYNADIARTECRKLIREAVNFILSVQQQDSANFFPIVLDLPPDKRPPSPLRTSMEWCYGDLGVVYSLLLASDVLRDGRLRAQCVQMVNHLVTIKNNSDEVADGGLAHGAAGAWYMFFRLHSLLNDEQCYKAAEYWLNETFRYYNHEDALASLHYKAKYDIGLPPASDIGFMSGITGMGIQYMICLNNEMDVIRELLYT